MGTYPTGTFDATGLAVYIAEIWTTRKVNMFYQAKLAAAKFFLNMSEDVVPGGDTVHIPNFAEVAAATKSNATAVTVTNPTETKIDLVINTWKECSLAIEDIEAQQVLQSYNIQKIFMTAIAYSPAKALDAALLALYSGLDNNVNDSASAVADADILSAIQTLDTNDVPAEDRRFFFYPSMKSDLAVIQKYYDQSQFGGQAIARTGSFPTLYGIPITFSTMVTISHTDYVHNLLAHKDAFAFATQTPGQKGDGVRRQVNYIPHYLATLVTGDIIYGVIENRDICAVEIRAIT